MRSSEGVYVRVYLRASRFSTVSRVVLINALACTCYDSPHDLADFDAPLLVQQQHSQRALLLGEQLAARLCTHEKRGLRQFVAGVGDLCVGIGARREKHLADPAETDKCSEQQLQARHRASVVDADQTVIMESE